MPGDVKRRPVDLVKTAQRAIASGELERAESLVQRGLERSPRDAALLGVAGVLATAREEWEPALAHLDALLALDGTNPWAHFARARALLGLDRLDDALAALHRSRDLDPSDPGLYELEATILRARGELDAALYA